MSPSITVWLIDDDVFSSFWTKMAQRNWALDTQTIQPARYIDIAGHHQHNNDKRNHVIVSDTCLLAMPCYYGLR